MAYAPKQIHAPADETVNLPPAVRAAAARSEQLVAATIAPPQDAPTHSTTPVEPIIDTEEAPTEPSHAPTTQAQPISMEELEALRQRALAAEGRAKAEAQANSNLRQLLAAANMQAPVAHATPPQDMTGLVTSADREAFGDEFIDLIRRAARESVGQDVADIRQQLGTFDQKFQGLGQVTQQQAKSSMFASMDAALPEWRAINEDPKFLTWLDLTDAFSGVKRMQLLSNAVAQADPGRALTFFKTYLAESGIVSPPSAETRRVVPTVSLTSLAAPGRPSAQTSSAEGSKPIITRAQIAKFYQDVAAHKYDGRDKERIATERAIFAAQADNRIQT